MSKLTRTFAFALFIGLLGITNAGAQTVDEMNSRFDMLYGNHEPYRAFFEELKAAVVADDKEAVAGKVDYPLQTEIDGQAVTIADAANFVADYDRVFTAKVKEAVANQTYETLFANSEGVMIGDGEVWFTGICNDDACQDVSIRIVAINN